MIEPKSGEVRQLVVLLHGYGSDGNDLIGLAPFWRDHMPDALFIAPNAPERCDINPMGYQWFPLDVNRELSRLEGAPGARTSLGYFLERLWAETGLGPAQTILLGFSQGAMMALDVGLRLKTAPIALIAFSGALIDPDAVARELGGRPPVCLVHGSADPVVPAVSSEMAAEQLQALGLRVAILIEPGVDHTITPEGLGFALAFLREAVQGSPAALQ
ncbi:MAG: phospholipase [Hyphomicrobiaceae bacterium]|nr:phospholipase [Hyphomicrobiaceae bacterium]